MTTETKVAVEAEQLIRYSLHRAITVGGSTAEILDRCVAALAPVLAEQVKAAEGGERKTILTVLSIMTEGKPGAALNAVTEDYPKIAAFLSRALARAEAEAYEDAIRAARATPFRAHSRDDVDFHSGCQQTQDRICQAIRDRAEARKRGER